MIRAIVTGHSRGLGAGIAAALLARGAAVLGLARGGYASLSHGRGTMHDVALDLADSDALAAWLAGGELRAFLAGATQALLVNNAGLVQPVGMPGKLGGAQLARAVAVNVTAPLMLADAFVAATDMYPDRRVLHVSSGAGRQPYAGWSAYCATKAALDMHARAVALDAIPSLRIASVAPGVIDTDMQAEIRAGNPDDFPSIERFIALKQEGGLADAAGTGTRLVDYLLGERYGIDPVTDLRQLD